MPTLFHFIFPESQVFARGGTCTMLLLPTPLTKLGIEAHTIMPSLFGEMRGLHNFLPGLALNLDPP
jgi:hypothetical protein